MMPASNRGAGTNLGFPDVCLTPAAPSPLPIPYPNIGLDAQATPFSPNVKVSQMNALNIGSTLPMTSGDEGGTAHATFKGSGRWSMGNPIVKINMMPAINLLCPSTGNNANNPLGAQVTPCVTNVFLTMSAPASPSVEGLARVLTDASVHGRPITREIALVRITAFAADIPRQLENTIIALQRQSPRRLIVLDLRDNPGGDLIAALRSAECFLPAGLELGRLIDADGDEDIYRSMRADPLTIRLAVLVGRHTASAAEVFAGALLHHGRATIHGPATRGKGSVQRVLRAFERGPTYATVGRAQLPDGRELDGLGLPVAATRSL